MAGKITVRERVTSGDIFDPEQRAIRFQHQKRLSDSMWIISLAFAGGVVAVFVAVVVWILN